MALMAKDQYACGADHIVEAWDSEGWPVDLTGYLCPICIGKVLGHGSMIDARILAKKQEPEYTS